jgi:hypothetical protein
LGARIKPEKLITMWMRSRGGRLRLPQAGPPRVPSHGVFRVAAVAVAVAAIGVTAGSVAAVSQQAGARQQATARQQAVSLSLGYSCAFSSRSRPVTVRITASFPATARAGQQVKPTGTGITVTLPHAAVTAATRRHWTSVAMTAGLATEITDAAKPATGLWRDFRSPPATVPASGVLTLTASGTAAPVTVTTAGQATVVATGLSLLLRGQAGHRPAGAASLQAVCVPGTGQRTLLATIVVTGSGPARTADGQAGKLKHCVPFIATPKLNPRLPLPRPLPGATPHRFPEEACANSAGFTNARRLHEAALIGPGLADLVLGIPTYIKSIPPYTYIYQRASGRLEYHGLPELPPARATLLAFGFMPVTATIQISEIGPLNVALISCGRSATKLCPNPLLNRALLFGRVSLRIYDVSVNGVPLNVGPHCQTATPFNLELTGVRPSYNISRIHGVLTGTVTIPSFSGCANGADNLDPVFDATVSGPGNFAKVTQAVPCFRNPPGPVCPPHIPVPKH